MKKTYNNIDAKTSFIRMFMPILKIQKVRRFIISSFEFFNKKKIEKFKRDVELGKNGFQVQKLINHTNI